MHAYIVYFFQRAVQIVRGKRPRATTLNGDGKRGGGLLYFSANIMLCEGAVPWAVATKVGRSPIYIYIYNTPLQMVDQKPNSHVCRIDATRVKGLKPRPTRQKELETFFNM